MSLDDRDNGWEKLERELFESAGRELDRKRALGIRDEADRIVSMILTRDMPRVDIEIAIREFRRRVLEEFPDKGELFDAVYAGRFRRIWDQFRQEGDTLLEDGA